MLGRNGDGAGQFRVGADAAEIARINRPFVFLRRLGGNIVGQFKDKGFFGHRGPIHAKVHKYGVRLLDLLRKAQGKFVRIAHLNGGTAHPRSAGFLRQMRTVPQGEQPAEQTEQQHSANKHPDAQPLSLRQLLL